MTSRALLPFIAAILAYEPFIGAADENNGAAFKEAPSVPNRFYELPPVEKLVIQLPEWAKAPPMLDPLLQREASGLCGPFMFPSTNDACVVAEGSNPYGFTPPLKLVTSPLRGSGPVEMLGAINRTTVHLAPDFRSKAPKLGFLYDVVDLFGCQRSATLTDLINALDNSGILVLPFVGVDLSKIHSLPHG